MSEIVNKVVLLSALTPHPRNYRNHPDEQLAQIGMSHARFGQFRSVVLKDEGNDRYTIVAGHGVVEAMKRNNVTQVRADVLPTDTPQSEVDAILIADNLHAQNSTDDDALLAALLQEQQNAGFDLSSLGSDDETLRQMLESLGESYLGGSGEQGDGAGGDEFDATPDEGPTRTHVGELWQMGKHRLLVGDSTKREDVERLMQGEKADMMFTDPPYGVNYSGGGHFDDGEYIPHERELLANDKTTEIYATFLPVTLPFVDGPCYMWFAGSKARDVYNAVFDNRCEVHALIIWHKTNATYAALNAQYKQRHEPCLYFKPKGSTLRWIGPTDERTVWELPRDAQNTYHPTQKPVSLSARAISNHDIEIVLDVFGGSGSTLIAAHRAKKTCYMMELSPKYADVILKRYEAETGQTATLLDRVQEVASV